MADRVSVSIMIGGLLSRDLLSQFVEAIAADGAALDWDGTPFALDALADEVALNLCANEVAWGRFETIEEFCTKAGLSFVRWSGGSAGSFSPERVVHRGQSEPRIFAVTDDDEVVIGRDTVRQLGSIEAIEQHFADAGWQPPALVIVESQAA